MTKVTLPPLPSAQRARIFHGMASVYSPADLRARDIEVVRCVMAAAAKVCRDFDATDSLSNYGLVLARMIDALECTHD